LPQPHGDADDLVPGLEQHGGGDRGVDAARHGGQDSHYDDLSRSTAGGMTSRARSTSASVVVTPRERRRAPSARSVGTPIAVRTWDGSTAPLVQADPADAHTPAPSSSTSNASDSTSPNDRWQLPAILFVRSPVSALPGTAANRPSARRSRRRATRPTVTSRPATVACIAAAIPAIPATLYVPLRRSRSWPPPWMIGRTETPSRTTRAPTPLGPPNLWALTATRSASAARVATSSHGKACTASVWSAAPGAAARTSEATSARGWM